jgi:pimeloyl-ACP methyl ester carboxylesterase
MSVAASAALVRRVDPLLPALMATPIGRTAALGQFFGRPWRLPAADAVAAARNLAFSSGVRPALDAATATTLEPLETDTPVTIAWGRRDLLLSASQRHRIQALIPTADIVLLDGCGHLPITDDPDAVARLILARTCASRPEPIHA